MRKIDRLHFSKKLKTILFATLSLSLLSSCNYANYISANKAEFSVFNSTLLPYGLMVVPNKNRIDVLSMQTNRVFDSLETGERPSGIASYNNLVLVSNTNSGNVSAFLKVDNDSFKTLGTIDSGLKPNGIAFNLNPEISEAYVVSEGDGKMIVLDTKDKNVLPKIKSTFDLKSYSPRKIAVSKDGAKIYLTDNQLGKLIILNRNGSSFNKSEITLIPDLEINTEANKNNLNIDGICIDQPVIWKSSKDQKIQVGTGRVFIADYAHDNIIVVRDDKIETTISLRDNIIVENNNFINAEYPGSINISGITQVGPKNMTVYRNPEKGIEKLYITGNIASVVSVIDLKTLKLIKNIRLTGNPLARSSYNPVGITNGILASKEEIIYITNTSGSDFNLVEPITDNLKRNFSTIIGTPQGPYGEISTLGMPEKK